MDRKQLADNVRARINVVEVVGRYVQLSRAGNNHKGLCPFHNEATPSFLVSQDKGIFKCFGCGEGGDAISFVAKMEGISYSEALARLAETIGIDQKIVRQLHQASARNSFEKEFELLKFVQGFYHYYLLNTKEGKQGLEYLASRGITKEIIERFGIGLAPHDPKLLIKALEANAFSFEIAKDIGLIRQRDLGDYYAQFRSRIMFQVTNEQGNVVGFSGRTYIANSATGMNGTADSDQAKYINSPESQIFQKSQIVYHLHEARKTARTTGRLLIFEGFLDVIAAYKAGFTEAVATMGTALTTNHAKMLSRHCREVVLVFDGDQAGLAATSKAIPILLASGLRVSVASLPNGLDPDDFIKQNGSNKFVSLIEGASGAIDFQYEYLKQGLNLGTTDGQVEFERRLIAFGNNLPDRSFGQALLRKLKDEIYEQRRGASNNKSQHHQEGLYRRSNQGLSSMMTTRLQVLSGEVKAEKELIYYMLLDKQIFELVLSQIGTAFNIDAHRKVVQGIEAYYFSNNEMNQEEFLRQLDPQIMQVTKDIISELRKRPRNWSKEMIIELTDKVQKGALKLERAGKKEMFYKANHEQQLIMMEELTAGLIH